MSAEGRGPAAVLDMKRRLADLHGQGYDLTKVVDTLYDRAARAFAGPGFVLDYVNPSIDREELEQQGNATDNPASKFPEYSLR